MSTPPPISVFPAVRAPGRGLPAARRLLMGGGRTIAGLVIVLLVTAGGIGWLYTLRRVGLLDAGPRLAEALPLQRLAGGAAQPVMRLVCAWLPAGVVAGLALRAVGFRRPWTRAAWAFAGTLVLLLAVGAVADAVTASDPLTRHIGAQPQRLATWLGAGLVAAGAALPRRARQ